MFRDKTKSTIDPTLFGAGSIVVEDNKDYLVVCHGNQVRLLDLETFELLSNPATVEDVNFLSTDEAKKLIDPLNGTMSDYDFQPKGLKGWARPN